MTTFIVLQSFFSFLIALLLIFDGRATLLSLIISFFAVAGLINCAPNILLVLLFYVAFSTKSTSPEMALGPFSIEINDELLTALASMRSLMDGELAAVLGDVCTNLDVDLIDRLEGDERLF